MMAIQNQIQAKAFVVGNNIDTDQIFPGRYLTAVDPAEIAKHCLEDADPTIAPRFQKGEIIVAGTNFGCGSSREHAAIALVSMGVSVVIADSFARIFFRNATNLALPLLVCKGIAKITEEGDELAVDLQAGTVKNLRTGEVLQGERISDYAMNILNAGGIKPLFREKAREINAKMGYTK